MENCENDLEETHISLLSLPLDIFLKTAWNLIGALMGVIVAGVLRSFTKAFDIIGRILIALTVKYPKHKTQLPPIGDREILKSSVSSIALKIRKKEVSCEEVVRTFINRLYEVNGELNALVDERFNEAIQEAKNYDLLINSSVYTEEELGSNYPILGVPFTIKDSFSVKGLKHTAGLYYRKDISGEEDADVVKILKKSGGIPLGVTNVSELCMWWESVNTVYGRSKNPYDNRHITGGSSGGEASVQGAAGSAFGVGSDIGGSIRMPAFFCGVYGHKPSIGLISNGGQEPKTSGRIAEFLTTGPLVRHPEDLKLLFEIMVGENRDKLNKPIENLSNLKIYYMEDDGGSPMATPISNELKNTMRETLDHFERKYGVKAQRANVTKLYHSLEIWAHGMCGAGAPTFCEELALRERKINPFWELVKYPLRLSPHTFPALILGIIEKVAYVGTNTKRHKEMIQMGYTLAQDIQDLLGDGGILVYPTHPTSAPRHYVPMFRPSDFSYTAIFNVLGLPVTQIPLGLGENGLPLGIQIVGGLHNDLLLLKIAEEVGGWVPPCHNLNNSI